MLFVAPNPAGNEKRIDSALVLSGPGAWVLDVMEVGAGRGAGAARRKWVLDDPWGARGLVVLLLRSAGGCILDAMRGLLHVMQVGAGHDAAMQGRAGRDAGASWTMEVGAGRDAGW